MVEGNQGAPNRRDLAVERGEFAAPAVLRPYQLLCVVCCSGEEPAGGQSEKLRRVREAVREDPDMPITLVCNVGDVYLYQDPGTAEDSPEGADYNRKRDLDILHLLALAPGKRNSSPVGRRTERRNACRRTRPQAHWHRAVRGSPRPAASARCLRPVGSPFRG